MRTSLLTLICIVLSSIIFSQQITDAQHTIMPKNHVVLEQSELISIPYDLESKILSGMLIRNISEKKYLFNNGLLAEADASEKVVIYVNNYPSADQISNLENLGVKYFLEIWTPPLSNHPYGYFLAEVPVNTFTEALSLAFIKKMDTAEYENFPQNNSGVISINADDVWTAGYDGTGVKVGVLDSGIDTFYDGTEFPSSFERMDYSAYPTIDAGVENTVTGHGTHVAGTVLGRGTNSIGRTNEGNGSTPFKGSAPGANLTFLKIGSDATGSASSAAMLAAMDAAVNIYNVDVLSMSYGGWHTYHDGSESLEQKVDWVYLQGVPFFISAGNSAADGHHYSGTVGANSSSDFIPINVNNGAGLSFNLVWYDGLGTRNNLFLEYYNTSQVQYTTNITQNTTTESIRGTESKYSWRNLTVPAGTYYLKVVNNSPNTQFYHIYFYRQTNPVLAFVNPDPEYTIGQPASADNGFAVGSYVSRYSWIASDGTGPWSYAGYTLNDIALYSSRGPRVNGGVIKPNISAPGHAIISIRDTDALTIWDPGWIDNDGLTGVGNANYYVMTGTSMACPITAGAAALLLDKEPTATPQQIYNAIQSSAYITGLGTVPNSTWGYGKLDVLAASEIPLPVELSSFSAAIIDKNVKLTWQTATEINNYGFEVEKMSNVKGQTSDGWDKIGFVNGSGNSNSPKDYSFVDDKVSEGKYSYRLKQIDNDGEFEYSKSINVDFNGVKKFELSQNYPNPFNPTTTIHFNLLEAGNVKLTLFNILGQEIRTLVNEFKESGVHTINFDASDLNSGMYIYKIESGSFVQTRKMTLAK